MKDSLHQTAFLNTPESKRIFPTTVGNFAVRNPYSKMQLFTFFHVHVCAPTLYVKHAQMSWTNPLFIQRGINNFCMDSHIIIYVCFTCTYVSIKYPNLLSSSSKYECKSPFSKYSITRVTLDRNRRQNGFVGNMYCRCHTCTNCAN